MTDSGKGHIAKSVDPHSPARPLEIGYAEPAEDSPASAWRRSLAIVVGVWMLVLGSFSLHFVQFLFEALRPGSTIGPSWASLGWIEVAKLAIYLIHVLALFAGGIALIIGARRRTLVRNVALAVLLLNLANIVLTVVSMQWGGAAGAVNDENILWVLLDSLLYQSRNALPVLMLFLATTRADDLPWRWTFRLGWWAALLVLAGLGGYVIQHARFRGLNSTFSEQSGRTFFHEYPEFAVQALAGIVVLSTLLARSSQPRRAALFGGAGLLTIVGCEVFAILRPGLSGDLAWILGRLSSFVGTCGVYLIPVAVLAICRKRLPDGSENPQHAGV